MATGRDPLERVVDALVALPVCTAIAAARVVPVALHAGARQLARVAAAAAGEPPVAHGDLPAVDTVVVAPADTAPADVGLGDVGPPDAVPAVVEDEPGDDAPIGADELPIDGYDQLAARQIVDRLASLTSAELGLVGRYEREHRHRSTVLGKIDQLTSVG